MATYVLLPGAGSDSTYWQFVIPLLRQRGHDVVAPDLPTADDSAGLEEYADVVVEAVGDRRGVVLVAQSMAGFLVPLVFPRIDIALVVLVAAMVPAEGESAGDWWANTGQAAARRALDEREGRDPDAEFDPVTTFLHDLPPEALAVAGGGARPQSNTPFERTLPMPPWPDVPTRFLLCTADRLFPADFLRRVVRERLGVEPDAIDCGHLPALARPAELVERIEGFRTATIG
ncbi:alpha/beta hydrolase [Rhodococcus sp. NPDC003318]|uniref:alpha/beta hydrolase n=1 Tax=Rhodococcus sp. NPDC003318 TaxID=3364503 RepID=UPI00368F9635